MLHKGANIVNWRYATPNKIGRSPMLSKLQTIEVMGLLLLETDIRVTWHRKTSERRSDCTFFIGNNIYMVLTVLHICFCSIQVTRRGKWYRRNGESRFQ